MKILLPVCLLALVSASADEKKPDKENAAKSEKTEAKESRFFDQIPISAVESIFEDMGIEGEEIGHGVWRLKMGDYTVVFYNQFDRIQLFAGFAGFSATLEQINEWNHTRRFSRAYLDENGDPCLESDLSVRGGVGKDNVRFFFEIFQASVDKFAEGLGQ